MGIEPYLLAPSLIGVVAQRLVRTICPACAESYAPDPEELAGLGLPELPAGVEFARGRGCNACHKTGYQGRTAVRELLELDDGLRAMVARNAGTEEMRAHVAERGWRGMRFAALRLLLARETTTREVLRLTKGS
jgi:type II secretory ATPase GspE/PulE/Tfp pilus assembly ATPase PilB-like protein